jgi:uncharacterized protein (TIGR02145 family)
MAKSQKLNRKNSLLNRLFFLTIHNAYVYNIDSTIKGKRMIKQKHQKVAAASVIFGAFLIFGFVSALLFAPIIKTNADTTANTKLNATVNPVVSLALDNSTMEFNIIPTSAGTFNSQSVIATVNTNSTGGYELFFSAKDDATAMTSLTSASTIESNFIGNVTSATMLANKWGYSLDATNFSPIPTLSSPTKIKDLDHYPASNEKNTTVNIAVKTDTSLPSGTYVKDIVFSAVAHPSVTPHINRLIELTSMQDPNLSRYCSDTYTPTADATEVDWDSLFFDDLVPRAVVSDARDSKEYLISKLADGNCWMSQNLALDLTANATLTDTLTDLNSKSSWTITNTTQIDVNTQWGTDGQTASAIDHSYAPASSAAYMQGGITAASSPTANTDAYRWEKSGNLYNFYAATAGSGTWTSPSGNVADSICPKGWMLPVVSGNKSFQNLVVTIYDANSTSMSNNPLNFIQLGYFRYLTGFVGPGGNGAYWSQTIWNMGYAHGLSYSDNSILSGSNFYHDEGNGVAIRCVAR